LKPCAAVAQIQNLEIDTNNISYLVVFLVRVEGD